MPKPNTIVTLKIRTRRIKKHLKANYLKFAILQKITGKPRVTLSNILNNRPERFRDKLYPRYTEQILTKIEEHFKLNHK